MGGQRFRRKKSGQKPLRGGSAGVPAIYCKGRNVRSGPGDPTKATPQGPCGAISRWDTFRPGACEDAHGQHTQPAGNFNSPPRPRPTPTPAGSCPGPSKSLGILGHSTPFSTAMPQGVPIKGRCEPRKPPPAIILQLSAAAVDASKCGTDLAGAEGGRKVTPAPGITEATEVDTQETQEKQLIKKMHKLSTYN